MKVLIAGCGRVGEDILKYLRKNKEIQLYVAEKSAKRGKEINEKHGVKVISGKNAVSVALNESKYNLAINVVPGSSGYKVSKILLESGTPVIDVSFYEEDAFKLEKTAIKNNTWYIPDCGVAPGLSNVFVAWAARNFKIEEFICYVGGNPIPPLPPFFYVPLFNPIDALSEYIRPARFVKNGTIKVVEPLSDVRDLEVEGLPYSILWEDLELQFSSFPSDGLRTLLTTKPVPNMQERTIRYGPHMECMLFLHERGLLNKVGIRAMVGIMKKFSDMAGDLFLMACVGRINSKKEVKLTLFDAGTMKRLAMSKITALCALSIMRHVLGKGLSPGIYPPEAFPEAMEQMYKLLKKHVKDIELYTP